MKTKQQIIEQLEANGFTRATANTKGGNGDFDNVVNAYMQIQDNPRMGLMLQGCVGCGKTAAIIALFPWVPMYKMEKRSEVLRLIDPKEEKTKEYLKMHPLHDGKPRDIILDDIGTDTVKVHYGDKRDYVYDYLMEWYSVHIEQRGIAGNTKGADGRLLCTSNLDRAGLIERYDDRLEDRLYDMTVQVVFKGGSKRGDGIK